MNKTSIEWTHRPETGGAAGGFTWNPIRANRAMLNGGVKHGTFCTRISPGCQHCYASVINKRFGTGAEYTVPMLQYHDFFIDEKILEEPLKRKKPATIFVGDMFDLFHEAIPDELICRVLDVCGLAKQHTFQILTKRAARMRTIIESILACAPGLKRPPSNLWFGISAENNPCFIERVQHLSAMPAFLRFISFEPLLEEINTRIVIQPTGWKATANALALIHWAIIGGESGLGARPMAIEWAESLRMQLEQAGMPVFMKQLGSNPVWPNEYWKGLRPPKLKDRKGGDPSEWPESLRVREFPHV